MSTGEFKLLQGSCDIIGTDQLTSLACARFYLLHVAMAVRACVCTCMCVCVRVGREGGERVLKC